MTTQVLILEILAYGFALWLGLYLIARDPQNPRLRYTGLGLVAYALGLAGDVLGDFSPFVARWGWPFLFVPALFWSGATAHFVTGEDVQRTRFARLWDYALFPIAVLFVVLAATTNLLFDPAQSGQALRPGTGVAIFALLVVLPLMTALVLLALSFPRSSRPRRPVALLLVATLFFGLGLGPVAFSLRWLPPTLGLLGLGFDLVLLGFGIAVLDAFDEGETLLPDVLRSLGFSFFTALLFGGQVALTMALGTGVNLPLLALLLATVAASIAIYTFSGPLQAVLDRLVLARFPRRLRARAELRAASDAVSRVRDALHPDQLDEAEFARLTRRALSHFGNLPRLAASPLTRLPLIDARLAARGADGNTLERAAELKAVLTESIQRLKPRTDEDFGTSDEWRYYNALHFPYVAGLKVHSRRTIDGDPVPTTRAALEWFRTYVPERTLFNWQNAAARLVAQDLTEQSKAHEES